MLRIQTVVSMLSAAIVLTGSCAVLGQSYPIKPVRVIVPTAPGGGINNLARLMAQRLNERWGQPVIVDNRPGANNIIAMDIFAQAPPDGYTLMAGTNSMILNSVTGRLNYDIRDVYYPAVQMTTQPYVLLLHPSMPINSVKEFITYAKGRPKGLNYASTGVGSLIHFGSELFNMMAGIKMVHVPYKGTGPAIIDLIGGNIQVFICGTLGAMPHIKTGKLKAVGVTSLSRIAIFPELPTFSESGVAGYELRNTTAVYAPTRTPRAVLLALNKEVGEFFNAPEMKAKIAADGSEAVAPNTPEAFRKVFVAEVEQWEKLIKRTGIGLGN